MILVQRVSAVSSITVFMILCYLFRETYVKDFMKSKPGMNLFICQTIINLHMFCHINDAGTSVSCCKFAQCCRHSLRYVSVQLLFIFLMHSHPFLKLTNNSYTFRCRKIWSENLRWILAPGTISGHQPITDRFTFFVQMENG